MIGIQYPIQGLQPFTKRFGQALHELEESRHYDHDQVVTDQVVIERIEDHSPTVETSEKEDVAPIEQENKQPAAFEVEKALDFSYDSDGDESVTSIIEETPPVPQVNRSDDDDADGRSVDTFLVEHSDILPADAPVDTINTLKALKLHIETSENRSFTNLERQLLATIVQHGIFNSQNEQSSTPDEIKEAPLVTAPDSVTKDVSHETKKAYITNESSMETASTKQSNIKVSSTIEPTIAQQNLNSCVDQQVSNNNDSQKLASSVTKNSQFSTNEKGKQRQDPTVNQQNPSCNNEKNSAATSANQDEDPAHARRTLLPTPGSIDEVVLVEDERKVNLTKRMLKLEEQKKMAKTVESLKINNLLKQQNSYHPDDEPAFELLESMAMLKRTDSGPAYEDLLNSFKKEKVKLNNVTPKEPKYRSKTKILPPGIGFLKRQQERAHLDNSSSHSSRRVVRREDYHREERGNNRAPTRKVRLGYKEDNSHTEDYDSKEKPHDREEDYNRKRKKNASSEEDNNKTRAVDILANLITQKFISKMTAPEPASVTDLVPGLSREPLPMPQTPINPFHGFQLPPFMLNQPPIFPPPMMPPMMRPMPIQPVNSLNLSAVRPNLITITGNGHDENIRLKPLKSSTEQEKEIVDTIPLKEPLIALPNALDYIDLKNPDNDSITAKDVLNMKNINVEDMVVENEAFKKQ